MGREVRAEVGGMGGEERRLVKFLINKVALYREERKRFSRQAGVSLVSSLVHTSDITT